MGVKVAMVQMQGLATKEENIAKATKHIGVAVANGAEIVCLQELFNTIYFCYEANPEYFDLAEPIPGPTINAMAEVATKHGIVLVAPIYEKAMAGELYNTATVLGPDGAILGKYRKSSIPLVTTPTICGYEKYYFRPGNTGFEVFPTPFGIKVGILICHDRNFPEAARILGLRGADIVLMPFATGGETLYRWEVLTRAHAMANSYYVGTVNRVGLDMGGLADAGLLRVELLCRLSRPDHRSGQRQGRRGHLRRAGSGCNGQRSQRMCLVPRPTS